MSAGGNDGEDPAETQQINALQHELNDLQARFHTSKDKLMKLRKMNTQQEQEIDDCRGEIEELEKQISNAGSGKVSKKPNGEEEVNQEVGRLVKQVLQKRVPTLGADKKVRSDDSADEDDCAEPADATGGASVPEHDTVVVTYRMQMGSHDEEHERDAYKATFRIDSETTVLGLHKDVCKYWGCSHAEHALVKYQAPDLSRSSLELKIVWANDLYKKPPSWRHEPEDIVKVPFIIDDPDPPSRITEQTKLVGFGQQSILPKSEKAQLSLIQKKNFDLTKRELEEQDLSDVEGDLDDGATLLTASKKGVKTEEVEEPHVALLEPWPGLYHLLKERGDNYEYRQPWRRSRFMDFVCYGLLLLLSVLCLTFRNARDPWELRRGVSQTLIQGILGESSHDEFTVPFDLIDSHDEIWSWLAGPFHYQLFNENSTLRQHYLPVGYLRLRQHRVKERNCSVETSLSPTTCYYVLVDEESEETAELTVPTNSSWLSEPRDPNPLIFASAAVSAQAAYGRLQQSYSGSGYMIDYDLAKVVSGSLDKDLSGTSSLFLEDLPYIRQDWISTATRALSVELTLANYDLGGYVSAQFLVEYSASGAVTTTNWIKPFVLHNLLAEQVADVLDWIRWILGAVYICLVGLFYHIHEKVKCNTKAPGASGFDKKKKTQSGFKYVFSFYGLLDAAMAGVGAATAYMRLKDFPTEPTELTSYYSYLFEADVQENLAVAESAICALVVCRLVSFMQMDASIYRFYKVVRRCITLLPHFLGAFLPVYFATVFIGNAIWSPGILAFSTWKGSFLMIFMTYQNAVDVFELNEASHYETIPFILWCFMTTRVLLVSLFLAITVYAYFEVEILDGADPMIESWDRAQWLDWALWPKLFEKLYGEKGVGASWREDDEEDEDAEGDDAHEEDLGGDAR